MTNLSDKTNSNLFNDSISSINVSVCRTCLLQKNQIQSIFEEDIKTMLMQCTSIRVRVIVTF